MKLSSIINVDKLSCLITEQGCSSSLLSAKDMAYDLAIENNAKKQIVELYNIYDELSEVELNSSQVVAAIEGFIGALQSEDQEQKFVSYLYPALKI